MSSRFKSAAFGVVAIVVTVGLSIVLFETALRITGRPFKGTLATDEEPIARFDPKTGWSYISSKSATQKFGTDQVDVTMHFDELGTRVATSGATLATDRPSVLLVGGSFMMGHGVSYEDSIAGQLGDRIELQVVNAAVQGFGTDQALVRLRQLIDRFDTKAVVYGFVCDHVRRNATEDRRLWMPARRFPGTKPAFALTATGVEQTHEPIRTTDLRYSRAWAYVRIVRVQRGPPPSAELTRALILEMKKETETRGARFATIDWAIRGTPALCDPDPLADLPVDLLRPAEAPPPGWATWFIPGDYHPSADSHAYVASLVATWLGP